MKLSADSENANPRGVGRAPAQLNSALANHIIGTKTTAEDALDLFASLGIPMPASGGHSLQDLVNRQADKIISLQSRVLEENNIITAMAVRAQDSQGLADVDRPVVDLMFDGHYNIRS